MTRVNKRLRTCYLSLLVLVAGAAAWMIARSQHSLPERDDAVKLRDNGGQKPTKPMPPDVGFVGSNACTRCHEAVAQKYRHHPMARSMVSVNDLLSTNGINGREFEDALIEPPGARKYLVRREANRLFHHERLPDAMGGDPVYDQHVEVSWVLGSGVRGRAIFD